MRAYKGEQAHKNEQLYWGTDKKRKYEHVPLVPCDDMEHLVKGWGTQAALEYILYLCGEHCAGHYQSIQKRFEEDGDRNSDRDKIMQKEQRAYLNMMEDQAAYNLRNSFAVVGVLHKADDFYDMISRRVHYLDLSLNPSVKGETHISGGGEEVKRCDQVFNDQSFRDKVMEESPEIAALARLYQVGLEVNTFQRRELDQCSTLP